MSPQPLNTDTLRQAVAQQYGQVAAHPDGKFPFPVGRDFAEELGYAPELLDTLTPSWPPCGPSNEHYYRGRAVSFRGGQGNTY